MGMLSQRLLAISVIHYNKNKWSTMAPRMMEITKVTSNQLNNIFITIKLRLKAKAKIKLIFSKKRKIIIKARTRRIRRRMNFLNSALIDDL